MKKLILIIVFVFSTITMINAKNEVLVKENNSPSDCVKSSRAAVIALADEFGWDIHTGGSEAEFAVEVYMIIYLDCLDQDK